MYGSGIKALDDFAGELEGNSELTFGALNSEVFKHSSATEEVRCVKFCEIPSKFFEFSLIKVS